MKIKALASTALAALSFTALAQDAVEIRVDQKNDLFSKTHVQVKVGQPVVFSNSDGHNHTVLFDMTGRTKRIGLQRPGEAEAVTFTQAELVKVYCGLHPNMRMTIEVVDG